MLITTLCASAELVSSPHLQIRMHLLPSEARRTFTGTYAPEHDVCWDKIVGCGGVNSGVAGDASMESQS